MNQILVTKKLYLTPELRKKKKLYKFQFIACVFLVCLLFSYYIYAEYDRSKSEEVSQEILAQMAQADNIETDIDTSINNTPIVDTTIKKIDNIIVVALDDNEEPEEMPEVIPEVVETETTTQTTQTATYSTSQGSNYTIEARLTIPRLGIDYPIIKECSEELLKISLNKYWGNEPNAVGNYCIVGHNYKNKKMFGRLSEIVSGDIVELKNTQTGSTVKYSVYHKYIVEPTDTTCTSQLTNGRKEVTLITCTNYGKQRLVVKAREIK